MKGFRVPLGKGPHASSAWVVICSPKEALRLMLVDAGKEMGAAERQTPDFLVVEGDLTISNETLPWGDFPDGAQPEVRLPHDLLRVKGDLRIEGLALAPKAARQLGGLDLTVDGGLTFKDCAALQRLPKYVGCKGDWTVEGCHNLTQLPVWPLAGNVRVADCQRFQGFTNHQLLCDSLEVSQCPSFTGLEDVIARDGLRVENCQNFIEFGSGVGASSTYVGGSWAFTLTGADDAAALGDVVIDGCLLASLPDGLKINGQLALMGCNNLKTLGRDLSAKELLVVDCRAFEGIGEGLQVAAGNVTIEECPMYAGAGPDEDGPAP